MPPSEVDMRVVMLCLFAWGCDARGLFLNETSDLEVVQVQARRSTEDVRPDRFAPPLAPGEEAPMTWHRGVGNGAYWFVEVRLADGRVGFTSWAITSDSPEPDTRDFVFDDTEAEFMFSAAPRSE